MRTPRTRYVRRPHDHRRILLRLVLWGVPVVVSVLTLIYAHKILESRQRAPEVVSQPSGPKPDLPPEATTKAPVGMSDAEVERLTAAIRKGETERRKTTAQERELKNLKREVERLKAERQAPESQETRPEPKPEPRPELVARPQPATTAESVSKSDPEAKARAAVATALGERSAAPQAPEPVAVKPEPVPQPKVPQPDTELEYRRREELQSLYEKAVVYRQARDPERLLEVLMKLQKLRPRDPGIPFGLGEVYGSFGKQFDLAKARSTFQRFLELTTPGKFDPESLHSLSPIKERDLQQVRLEVRHHLALLEKKHRLLLVTSHSAIAKMVAGLEKERKERYEVIAKYKAWIATRESQIESWRRSRRFDRHSKIKALKRQIEILTKRITHEEGQIEFVTAELGRIQEATQK